MMKKTMALFLALLMLLALSACGGSGGTDTAADVTYTLYAMDYEDGIILTEGLFEGENYITLKSGGKAELCLEDEKNEVKWKADGTKLTFTASDGDMDGSLSNGVLSLVLDDSNLYFVANDAAKARIKAVSLEDLLFGGSDDDGGSEEPDSGKTKTPKSRTKDPSTGTQPEPSGPSELQKMWNGWYYGCIDMSGCTDNWAFLNGATYDAVLYVELNKEGVGQLAVYDPFGNLISNEHSNIYVKADCHADELYLYADDGYAFNDDIKTSDWRFVRNTEIPEKLHVGSTSSEDSGATIGYDFQFKPWGDRWEGDNYTQFIPYFESYISAVDTGITCPFGDTFPGFGIAEPDAIGGGNNGGGSSGANPAPSGGSSALLGANPAKLDINDSGVACIYYPADQFEYDDWYGKLKNEKTGVGIMPDPMLGAANFAELKASYEENNSDEDDYSLVETTVCGYKALIMKYSDWLGATMRVDIDFGGNHDDWYGISFSVSGDSLEDCDSELVWAIIGSLVLL